MSIEGTRTAFAFIDPKAKDIWEATKRLFDQDGLTFERLATLFHDAYCVDANADVAGHLLQWSFVAVQDAWRASDQTSCPVAETARRFADYALRHEDERGIEAVDTVLVNALAAKIDEEDADQNLEAIGRLYAKRPFLRKHILDAVHHGTSGPMQSDHIFSLLALNVPKDIKKVLLKSLVRNSDCSDLVRSLEFAPMIEGLSDSGLVAAKDAVAGVALFDSAIQRMFEDMKRYLGRLAGNHSIGVTYSGDRKHVQVEAKLGSPIDGAANMAIRQQLGQFAANAKRDPFIGSATFHFTIKFQNDTIVLHS